MALCFLSLGFCITNNKSNTDPESRTKRRFEVLEMILGDGFAALRKVCLQTKYHGTEGM